MSAHQWTSSRQGQRKRRLPKVVACLMVAGAYWFPVRRWFGRWGTTPEELARVMPGDALIPNPTEMSMQAVT